MKNKLVVVFMFMILAFSVAGASYAIWTSSVTFNGTATMGNIDLIIKSAVTDATSNAFISTSYSLATDKKSVDITLGNLYPGAEVNITVTTRNKGSLPLAYNSFQLTSSSEDDIDDYFWLGFYAPALDAYNLYGTFDYLKTIQYYASWGIPVEAVTIDPLTDYSSLVTIRVANTLPESMMGESLTVTFVLTGALAA